MVTSKYFSQAEISCKCGCGEMPTQEMADKADELREAYGQAIGSVCFKRCEKHNAAVGGALHSKHIVGRAADLARTPELLKFLLDNQQKFQVSIEDPARTATWIHIDLDQRSGKWKVFSI